MNTQLAKLSVEGSVANVRLSNPERRHAAPKLETTKRSVNRLSTAVGEAMMHSVFGKWLLTTRTKDFQECVTGYREKREPALVGD